MCRRLHAEQQWEFEPTYLENLTEAAYVAASVFNEGSFALLTFMQDMEISSGSSAHDWARSTDSTRISRAEQEAERQTKEGRIRRRQEQKDALDIIDDSNILYGPGIDDSVWGMSIKFAYKRFNWIFLCLKL